MLAYRALQQSCRAVGSAAPWIPSFKDEGLPVIWGVLFGGLVLAESLVLKVKGGHEPFWVWNFGFHTEE